VVKQMLSDDLKAYLTDGGKTKRKYLLHFVNELRGKLDYRCMFCY